MTGIPSQFGLLQKHLQQAAMRHQVASQNIANVNTPGYQAQEVSNFQDALSEADTKLTVRPVADLPERLDGNTVDIDKQIGDMERSSILHKVYTQILATKARQMRSAITGQ